MISKGIDIFDEVGRDGQTVSALLLHDPRDCKEIIESLTREQKIIFLKYAAKEVPEHFSFYNEDKFNNEVMSISDTELNEMVEEVDWIWK